tara:strand:+ start:2367 stop:3113 length:747 start_codon:yes stop_codon:yes gene_type:complete
MKSKFDIIILSLATDDLSFNTTKKCVDSYITTANELVNKIYVVESNKSFDQNYNQPKVEVIIPQEEFCYNKFYNIALEKCKAEFVMGPNNDLIVHAGCLQTLAEEFDTNPEIQSICPIDRNWGKHSKIYFPNDDKLYYGYDVSLHMYGGIFCCRRSVFNTIGFLDERFYFFYQDNDYACCLQRCNLLHGAHTKARVSHQCGGSNRIAPKKFQYLPKNMNTQGDIFANKWYNEEPFMSGGYKQFKSYPL